jgi:predicted enzyme related to lactoylglutathione lyase
MVERHTPRRRRKEKAVPEVTTITPNTPVWFDLASPNLEGSKQFYGQLLGWDAEQVAGPEAGSYTMFRLRGKDVAAVSAIMGEGQYPAWTTYIASTNVDETAAKVRTAGGEIAWEPMDVMDAGRMCIFRDPTGAFLALWQPGVHKGAGIMREPGSVAWADLGTRDMPKAKQFYQQVFGWGEKTTPMGPGLPDYTEWKLNGESVAGAMDITGAVPAEVPPYWLVYFQIENIDQAAECVKQLGGQITTGPLPYPGGRFAVAVDPHGASFGMMEVQR